MTIHQPHRRRLAQLGARAGVVLSATMLVITGFDLSPTGVPGAGAAELAGQAQIVTPCDGPDGCKPLEEGDSATAFSLLLPTGAACTGDSANAGFGVTSFMVRGSVDLDALEFHPITGPEPQAVGDAFRQPLYEVGSGSAYTGRQTADATTAGGPGPVINIPAFDLSSAGFQSGNIPAGTYTLGIACIKGPPGADQLDNYWTAQMEVTADAGDPVGIAWEAVAGGGPGSSTSTSAGGSSTTAGGGSTSTSVGGSTSTSAGGSTSTSAGGSTSSSSTVGGSSSTTPISGTGIGSSLPATGSSPLAFVLWALLLLTCGRLAYLMSRPPRVPTRT